MPTHFYISTKAKVQEAYQFLRNHEIFFDFRDIFKKFDVSKRTRYKFIQKEAFSRTRHHFNVLETRDRKRKVSKTQLDETNQILQDENLQLKKKRYTWKQLTLKVEAEIVDRTMKRVMQAALNYHKCLVCVKEWLAESFEKRRLKWVTVMLNKYSKKENWFRVRFSDEMHFGYEFERQLHIIRKSDTRYLWDCIQHRDSLSEKDRKRLHCWAAMNYNFKSGIHIYDVLNNSNEKMTHQVYINFILEPVVKSWLKRGDDFVLKEDDDSGHDTSKTRNIVKSGRKITNWSIISTVLHLLIWSSLKIAECLLSNTYESIHIETTSACVNWSWRNEHEWVRHSSMKRYARCPKDCKRW
jgi:transposase